ncbi:arsenite efflux transporter metallochaperone ArsD [Georgenia daeguensis]|uniref:Arsenite efflux transporter metallochaperone ArsD n=1 Tax=Georgenia daeguensis TaxID=908355 RepID=A0ABP8EVQ6_9MICO
MSTIEVYEPAMCCSTGVCGTDVPQELVTFSADLDWLRSQGADVARYNLASEPTAFAGRPAVVQFLELSGSAGLPLVLVDGAVAMTGRYPDRDQLARWAELAAVPAGRAELGLTAVPAGRAELGLTAAPAGRGDPGLAQESGGCCGGTGCC